MLPETLERQVDELVEEYKRRRKTPFVSRLERRAMEEGLAEGHEKGHAEGIAEGIEALRRSVLRALVKRFGDTAELARPLVVGVSDLRTLETLLDIAMDAPTLEAFMEQAQALAPNNA